MNLGMRSEQLYSISQVIEALPEALIGGIYWGLAQVDDGQVNDMVGGHFLSCHLP